MSVLGLGIVSCISFKVTLVCTGLKIYWSFKEGKFREEYLVVFMMFGTETL